MKLKKVCLLFGLSIVLVGCGNKEITKPNEIDASSMISSIEEIEIVNIDASTDFSTTLESSEKILVVEDEKEVEKIDKTTGNTDKLESLKGKTYGGIPIINVYNLYSILAKESNEADKSLIPETYDELVEYMDNVLGINVSSGTSDFERFSAVSLLAEFSGHFEDEKELETFLSTEGYEINTSVDKYSEFRTEDGGISMSFSSETDGFNTKSSPDMTNREILKESTETFFSNEFKVVTSIDDSSKNFAVDFYGETSISFDTDSFSFSYTGDDEEFYVNSILVINDDSYNRILFGYAGNGKEVEKVILTDNLGHNITIK